MKGYRHNIQCPGKLGKSECVTCTNRTLKIIGHHAGKWETDNNTGESFQQFYVSTPCCSGDLLKQEIVIAPAVRSENLVMKVHTKVIDL